jgi:hypothetical protein
MRVVPQFLMFQRKAIVFAKGYVRKPREYIGSRYFATLLGLRCPRTLEALTNNEQEI